MKIKSIIIDDEVNNVDNLAGIIQTAIARRLILQPPQLRPDEKGNF